MSCILKACKLNQSYRGRSLYDKRNRKLSPGKSTRWICSALLSDIFPDWGGEGREMVTPPLPVGRRPATPAANSDTHRSDVSIKALSSCS